MDKEKIASIKVFQQEKETDELLTIWVEHDTNEWDEEAFVAIKEILLNTIPASLRMKPYQYT